MKYSFYIAKNYLLGKKSNNAINILSVISIVGMVFGTAALILVLSVYNGFENLVISLYDSFRADLFITAKEGKFFTFEDKEYDLLKNNKGIKAVTLVLEENALFDYDGKQYFAKLKGVDDNYTRVNPIDTSIIDGSFNLDKESNNAVLGLGVAKSLSLNLMNNFSKLRVFMPKKGVKVNPANPLSAVNIQYLKAKGLFSLEREFDSKYVFVPLQFAQELLIQPGKISAVEILLHDQDKMEEIKASINSSGSGNYNIKNKYEIDSTIYKVMKTEKWVAYLILTFILLIAAFNIIGSLSMMVIEKKKDISILLAMGATRKDIYSIFLQVGFLLSMFGAFLGTILAFTIGFLQKQFGIIKINANGNFLIDALPVHFKVIDFALILITIVVIGMFASYFPARRAANTNMNLKS